MSQFYQHNLRYPDFPSEDAGCSVKLVLKLIEHSEYYNELVSLFDIEKIKSETIRIPGSRTLVEGILSNERKVQKFDLPVHLASVILRKFSEDDQAILKIDLTPEQRTIMNASSIEARTVYNAKSDYFDGSYNLDKFSKFCSKEGHIDLLKHNISHLNEIYKENDAHQRQFRFLKDHESKVYLRALTSATHYKDYNIRFSVFIALISLHNISKSKGWQFTLNRFMYDESHIRVYIEKVGVHHIKGIGSFKFLIELSNDEIKREALQFNTAISLVSSDRASAYDLHIQARKASRSGLLSIRHDLHPPTVFKKLNGLPHAIAEAEKDAAVNIRQIAEIKAPDQIRHLIQRSIERSPVFKEHREQIKRALDTKIVNLHGLFTLMHKIDLLVSESLEGQEYLRYLYYDVLRSRAAH